MDVRFTVLIDLEDVGSLDIAYAKLRLHFKEGGITDWQTDDEFYVDGEQGDADQLSLVRTRSAMIDRIFDAYSTLDRDTVWLEAATKRTGSDHQETPHRNGTTTCPTCGTLEAGKGDPVWHPEQWLTE